MSDPGRSDRRQVDPTRVTAQPALNTASGTSWVVVALLLAGACVFPLSALLAIDPGPSLPVAIAVAIVVGMLLMAVLVLRFAVPPGPRRLRAMAWCTGALAATALIGLFVCLVIEWR